MNLLRHPSLRLLNLPALLAVLLLATLPTLGRMRAPAVAEHHAGNVALCTVQGLKSVHLDLVLSTDTAPVAPDHHQHDDCNYCPLLAALVQLSVVPGLQLLPPAVDTQPFAAANTFIAHHRRTGPSARGPPDSTASITA